MAPFGEHGYLPSLLNAIITLVFHFATPWLFYTKMQCSIFTASTLDSMASQILHHEAVAAALCYCNTTDQTMALGGDIRIVNMGGMFLQDL